MFKDFCNFRKIFPFVANLDNNAPPKHLGKGIILFLLLILFLNSAYDFLGPVLIIFGTIFALSYGALNQKVPLWRLIPLDYKRSINLLYCFIYSTVFIALIVCILLSLVGVFIMYLSSTTSEFNSEILEFYQFINGIFSIEGGIILIILFTLINLITPLSLIKNRTQRLSLILLFTIVLIAFGEGYKFMYDGTLSSLVYSNFSSEIKFGVLIFVVVAFFASLICSVNLSKKLYIKRYVSCN